MLTQAVAPVIPTHSAPPHSAPAHSACTQKLVLRLADSSGGGVHSQWHVASVDVLHKRSGWCTPFTFDEWLQVDSSTTRDKPQAARNVYQVRAHRGGWRGGTKV